MSKLIFVVFMIFNSAAFAEVISGEQAQLKYDEMTQNFSSNPEAWGFSESYYLGSDTHPELGKMKLTYVFNKSNANESCWKEDYFEAEQVFFGCKLN